MRRRATSNTEPNRILIVGQQKSAGSNEAPVIHRSSSAAITLMLPSTATTSLIMWPSISFGNTW